MKGKKIFLIIVAVIALAIGFNFIQSAIPWTLPNSLLGKWTGKQKVTVRFHYSGKYSFRYADSVCFHLSISETGRVEGNIGNAVFKDCIVTKNSGWISKFKNFSTDYMISSIIAGPIFHDDTLAEKGLRFPLYKISEHAITAAMYQSKGWDIFPMADVYLTKQE